MHQHRRRKKRPNYGVRTVEISRGRNGFGFTISGQAPCILSCIITGSPAERAGLRTGDFLIAVNGQNVSKAPHDDVVHHIGNSTGVLKLQIAENYFSDSSEEEFVSVAKVRPKHSNKTRHRQQNCVSRAEKVVQDLQTGALFVDHIHGINVPPRPNTKPPGPDIPGPSRTNKVLLDLILQQRFQNSMKHSPQNTCSRSTPISSTERSKHASSARRKDKKVLKSKSAPENLDLSSNTVGEVFHSIFTEQDLNNILYPSRFDTNNSCNQKSVQEQAILKAVVGYLGTIEMPKEPQLPNSRLQTIRNCIRRLRIEKKVHTLVLLSVFTESIVLINPQGIILAEFSADKITFSGVYCDDKKFFGLVTSHSNCNEDYHQEDQGLVSSSCHVFMVDPKLTPHHQHLKRAKAFHIVCTSDPVSNKCKEFPESADTILQAVVGLYRSKIGPNNDMLHGLEFHVNMSPQPSNTSSNSSNSDSGIGFRDEGNASDRVFIVDVESYPEYSTSSLDRQVFSNSNLGLIESPIRALSQDGSLSKSIIRSQRELNSHNQISLKQFDRLTVRAMPDPVGFERSSKYNSDNLECTNSTPRNTMYSRSKQDSSSLGNCLNQINNYDSDNLSNDKSPNVIIEENKLSPKVYGLNNFPLSSVDEALHDNVSAESLGWECTSCSTEDLQEQPLHLLLNERQIATEQDEIGSQDVHPPSQEEDSESELSGAENGFDVTFNWRRTSSLRRHLGRKRNSRSTREAGTVSDGEIASEKVSASSSLLAIDHLSDASHISSVSERPVDVSRVGSWAASFSVLLEDPIGLHVFSEFLKKEFSQENITFWIACEEYKKISTNTVRVRMAKEIFTKHLCIGAHEPVNVDSHARLITEEGLESANPDLFLSAQKQIFNLMKFDCYQRFLKSGMFKDCMLQEMRGETLSLKEPSSGVSFKFGSKDFSDIKKRKSILPWPKLGKSKSNELNFGVNKIFDKPYDIRKSLRKKTKEKDFKKFDDTSSTQSDLTGSRSSLTESENGLFLLHKTGSSAESMNSADLALFPTHCNGEGFYCRVILPNLSTTVVRTQKGETIGEMLLKLLERRSLQYNAVEAYLVNSHKPLDHCTDVTSLQYREIRVEQVILFCVELPNKKTIGVKAKNNKICGEILKPVLNKYGYKIENVNMIVASVKKAVVPTAPITAIDNDRIIVALKEFSQKRQDSHSTNKKTKKDPRSTPSFPDFEELTNQIFDDLLRTKPDYNGYTKSYEDRKKKKLAGPAKKSFHHSSTQHAVDTLQSEFKPNDVMQVDKIKYLAEHNILPHQVNTFDSKNTKNEQNGKELSSGKENFSINDKGNMKSNISFSSLETDYDDAFQNTESSFASDLAYSGNQMSDKYFSSPCYSSNEYEESSSEKFLQKLGIIPSDANIRNSRQMNWNPTVSPPPRIPPRLRSTDCSDSIALNSSHSRNLDSTLIANDSFSFDLDEIDVTLRDQTDAVLSPKHSFSRDPLSHLEEAISNRDLPKEITFPIRRLPCEPPPIPREPPPVPPKIMSRGPPPRPPSRQLPHPSFCSISDDEISEDKKLDVKVKSELSAIPHKNYLDLGKDYGDFNISFV